MPILRNPVNGRLIKNTFKNRMYVRLLKLFGIK